MDATNAGMTTEFKAILDRWREWSATRPAPSDIADLRNSFEEFMVDTEVPLGVDFHAEEADGVAVEWVYPPDRSSGSTILYFHGGGYVMGSIRSHRAFVATLAQATRSTCISVDYRLGPEHPFPGAVEDGVRVYRWLLNMGIDTETIAIAGDSAGGGLAVGVGIALRDSGEALPGAIVAMSPVTDLPHEGESMTTRADVDPIVRPDSSTAYSYHYVGDELDNLRHPHASPIYADFTGMPPILIQVGGREVLLDDSTRLADRIEASGGTVKLDYWDNMVHVFPVFGPNTPEGRQAISDIADFLQSQLRRP